MRYKQLHVYITHLNFFYLFSFENRVLHRDRHVNDMEIRIICTSGEVFSQCKRYNSGYTRLILEKKPI